MLPEVVVLLRPRLLATWAETDEGRLAMAEVTELADAPRPDEVPLALPDAADAEAPDAEEPEAEPEAALPVGTMVVAATGVPA